MPRVLLLLPAAGYRNEDFLAAAQKLGAEVPQPVGVLADAALPGAVRNAEVDPHAGVGGQLGVPGQLLALFVGQALAQGCGDRVELDGEARQRRRRSRIFHARQQHQAAGALDEHAQRGLVARALDEVALPVARHHSVVHLGRVHVDADHVGELPTPIRAAAARQARSATLAQGRPRAGGAARPGVEPLR